MKNIVSMKTNKRIVCDEITKRFFIQSRLKFFSNFSSVFLNFSENCWEMQKISENYTPPPLVRGRNSVHKNHDETETFLVSLIIKEW